MAVTPKPRRKPSALYSKEIEPTAARVCHRVAGSPLPPTHRLLAGLESVPCSTHPNYAALHNDSWFGKDGMAVGPPWRTVELCEMPMRNGTTAVAKVERDDFGVCYWRLNVADGDRLALITGGTASSIGLAKIFAWTAMRVALGVELHNGG
jgi:hypothetical protein